jgi:predicted nucleic acid-binding protein
MDRKSRQPARGSEQTPALILVDTAVWIDFFNGSESVEALHLRACIADARPVVIPGLVLTEILMGLRTEAQATRIADLLDAFETAPELEPADYRQAAEIYRLCRGQGFTIRSTIDCLIARLCLRHGYELLARDRDFSTIAKVFPLQRVSTGLMVQDRPRAGPTQN